MTTRATLFSDIETFYPHSDYTDSLKATFLRMVEAQIRRDVRVGAGEVTDTAFSQSAQSTALPTRFIAMRSVSLDKQGHRDLDYLSPQRLRSSKVWDLSGDPHAYTIEGQNLVVAPWTSTVTLQLVYYRAFEALSATTTTNWLLTNAYDIYLYGCLMAAAGWALDEGREAKYAAQYNQAVENINKMDRWGRVSGSALIRTGGPTP